MSTAARPVPSSGGVPPPEDPPTRISGPDPRRGRPQLRIIHRYLQREVLAPTGIAFGAYTFLMLMNQCFLLADYAYRYQVPLAGLGWLFVLQFPHIIVLTVPISLLVGLLIASSRMAADSEFVALSASGISLASLLRPVVVLASGFALLTGWLAVDVMPRSNFAITRTVFDIFRESLLRNVKPREFNSRLLPGFTFCVGDIERDAAGDVWQDVIFDMSGNATRSAAQQREVFFAREARPMVDYDAGVMRLRLSDVTVHVLSPGNARGYDVRTISQYEKILPPPSLFRRADEAEASKSVREMTVAELVEQEAYRGQSSQFLWRLTRVEIHKRFAIPSACLVFAFLGLGLGASARRSGRSFGFVVSLGVILVYYQLFYAGERLAVNGDIPPWLSMWAGNILFGVIGLLAFLQRVSEGRLMVAFGRVGRAIDPRPWMARLRNNRQPRKAERRRAPLSLGVPSLLDRYIFAHFCWVLLLVLGSVLTLYVVVTLSQLVDDILRNNIPWSLIAQLYLAWLPEILSYVLPVSVLVTTVIAFSLLTRTNEITAMLVNGVSIYRIVAPALVAGGLISLAAVAMYDRWLPRSAERYDRLYDEVRKIPPRPAVSSAHWAEDPDGKRLYHFEAYEPESGLFYRLSVFELGGDGVVPVRHVFADRAHWIGDSLVLGPGWERAFARGGELSYRGFESRELPFEQTRREFGREWRQSKHMSYAELRDYVRFRQARGIPSRELEVELYSKRSFPFISFVMMLLGLPFAFAIGKRGNLYGVGVAIAVAAVYWWAVVIMAYLGKLGGVPPLVAAWSPNILFATLGLSGFFNLRT